MSSNAGTPPTPPPPHRIDEPNRTPPTPAQFGFEEEIPDPDSFDDEVIQYQFLSLNENEQWFGEF